MTEEANSAEKPFNGFKKPRQNWSRLPHQLIDALPVFSSKAELSVVLYILRHTWGYQDDAKRISLDEFESGRKRKDGTRIDNGVGMLRQAIIDGLTRAEAHGFIVVETDDRDKGRVKKYYSLHLVVTRVKVTGLGYENHTPEVGKSHPRSVKTIHRTEKETLERNSGKKNIAPDGAPAPLPSQDDGYLPFDGGPNPDIESDDDDAPTLYPCTPAELASLIAVWFDWTPRRPEKRGKEITLSQHIANKTNREFAMTLWSRGVRPADMIRCMTALRERDDLKGKEINFVYAGEAALSWTERERADDYWTWDCPRITARKPGVTIDLGSVDDPDSDYLERLRNNPAVIVDVPPPFISLQRAEDDGDEPDGEEISIDDVIKQPGWEL